MGTTDECGIKQNANLMSLIVRQLKAQNISIYFKTKKLWKLKYRFITYYICTRGAKH